MINLNILLLLITVVLIFPTVTNAIELYEQFYGDEQTRFCSYFGGESLLSFPLSQHLKPHIIASLPERATYDKGVFVELYIASAQDLKKVRVANAVSSVTCLDAPSFWNYCHPLDLSQDTFSSEFHYSIKELTDDLANEFPVKYAHLNPLNNSSRVITYDVPEPGVYCTTFHFLGDSSSKLSPQELQDQYTDDLEMDYKNILSLVDENVYGNLDSYDFNQLMLEFYSSVVYSLLLLVFGCYIYSNISNDKKRVSGGLIFPNYLIQFKIVAYLFGSSIYHLFQYLYSREVNIYGYPNTSHRVGLLPLSFTYFEMTFHITLDLITILFITWAIYNFMLLSSGVFFGFYIESRRILVVNAITYVLTFEQLTSMISPYYFIHVSSLLYFENLLIFCLGSYWAYQTYGKLKYKSLSRKFMTTYILILLVFIVYFAFLDTKMEHIIKGKLDDRAISDSFTSATSSVFSFVVTSLVVFIWRDVRFVDNVIIRSDY